MIDHARAGRLCILILDDDRDFCHGLKTRLGRLSYHVLVVRSGTIGIRKARRRRPDAILVEANMAAGNGRHVLAELTSHPATRHIPVLLVTGGAQPMSVEQLREVGAAACLPKPIVMPTLLLALSRLVGRRPRAPGAVA